MKKILAILFVISVSSTFAVDENVNITLTQDKDLVSLTKCVKTDCNVIAEIAVNDETNVDEAADELANLAEEECKRSCNFITKGYNDTARKIRNNKYVHSVRIISFYTYLAIKQAITGELQAVRF